MTEHFDRLKATSLIWLPEHGIGYYPVRETPYDAAYFEKYRGYEATERGQQITAARVALVKRFCDGLVLDVGIGSGAFVEAHGNALGTDINPAGLAWLRERGREWDGQPVRALCFWDSLEHIHEPSGLLAKALEWVFVSVPIVPDANRLHEWKHFRRDEHCWYFTETGFCRFMAAHGFELTARDHFETRLGREDIGTYAFRRRL